MKLKLISFLLLTFLLSVPLAFSQKGTELTRRCVSTSNVLYSKISLEKNGNINLVPCQSGTLTINGSPLSGTFTSLNTLTAPNQVFATGAADTAAVVSNTATHTINFPIQTVAGTSRTNYLPYFSGTNALTKSVFSQANSTSADIFDGLFSLRNNTNKTLAFNSTGNYFIYYDSDGGNLQHTNSIKIGDSAGEGSEAYLNFDVTNSLITLNRTKIRLPEGIETPANNCTGTVTYTGNITHTVGTNCAKTTSKIFVTSQTGDTNFYIESKDLNGFDVGCFGTACAGAKTFDYWIVNTY